jgi:DNA-binding SARP family transcriptional activator
VSLAIHLLGRPRLEDASEPYKFRSRKSWALLAYLLLAERPPSRRRLAELFFSEAVDPLRALRWTLAEIRRGLGDGAFLEGDPVVIELPLGTVVDVEVLTRGSWSDAAALPGLGDDLLEGISLRDAAVFESWLLGQQRHIAAASEAILHEAALASMARGQVRTALDFALRAAAMNPLDENHHALLVRLYRLGGDDIAAEQQYMAAVEALDRELGGAPHAALDAARRERRLGGDATTEKASIEAILEAGAAAISAGAVEAGVQSLRSAVRQADHLGLAPLSVRTRLVLAEALIHSLRGLDEEGLEALFAAHDLAIDLGDRTAIAQARAEIGYVDYLRARYDRAERWLTDAIEVADGSPSLMAKATTYLGSVESDRASYSPAIRLLTESIALSRRSGEPKREAYALSMLGRIALLRGDLDSAAHHLDLSIGVVEREHWLAFLPWPQSLRGEVELLRGHPDEASELLTQAFARACQLGDPCWEGMSARGVALVAEARGETERAFAVLADARARSNRLADPYVWLDGYILDVQCGFGRRHDHPDTPQWVDTMRQLAARTGMREMAVRSLLHGAALGNNGDQEAARLLAADIDNPTLDPLLRG